MSRVRASSPALPKGATPFSPNSGAKIDCPTGFGDTQRRELKTTYDEILENVLTEWLARHSEALQASLNYGEVLRHAFGEFIDRHKEEFLPVF